MYRGDGRDSVKMILVSREKIVYILTDVKLKKIIAYMDLKICCPFENNNYLPESQK